MEKRLLFLLLIFLLKSNLLLSFGQTVVINEVLTSPPGLSSTTNSNSMYNTASSEQPPDNQEWIELFNPDPCNSVDISCYTIGGNMLQLPAGGSPMPNWGAFTFPSGTIIPPSGFIIIGGNNSGVPILDFNTTTYRQTSFGTQYLDGDPTRWFLRDEYGWVAIYNPNGNVVDAVYWDAYGNAANLFSASEYQNNIVTRTSCSGTQTLTAALNIAGIEYIGACSAGSYLSFQRNIDGANTWFSGPVIPTPRACNGPCIVPPLLSHTLQNESCSGGDGSITLTITDGHSGPYTTNWINPAGIHTNTLGNLSAGIYIVQVVGSINCFTVYDTITITAIPDPSITFSNINPETCDMNNGSVQTVVTNGNNPVNYVWNTTPPSNSANLSNLNAGTYTVSITDNLGCTASNTVTILDLPGPLAQIDSIHNEMCSASDGAVHMHISGGTLPLSFIWNSNPPQQTQNLTGVPSGNYSVTITDASGCVATADTVLTNKLIPVIVVDHLQSDTCNKRIGAIHILASAGNPPYFYHWSTSTTDILDHISHLSEGDYTVSVSDNFCKASTTVHVENYPGPKADFQFYPPVTTIEDPTFNFTELSTGIIDHWSWYFGDMMSSIDRNPIHTYKSVGTYDVMLKISNDNGCVDSIIKEAIVVDRPSLFVPNCFTPNGDNINDYFFAAGINITDFTIFIFDRWGELVFSSHSIEEYWDGRYKGKIVPEGIYTWTISYSENYAGVLVIPKTKKGLLALII